MSDIQRIVSGGHYCCNEVAKAVRKGSLLHPRSFPCADCGGQATEYDHRDYNEPLKVEPVCRGCNARRGKAIPRRWAQDELRASLERVARRLEIVPWARAWCLERAEFICSRIERHAGIPRHEMRPDIWAAPE